MSKRSRARRQRRWLRGVDAMLRGRRTSLLIVSTWVFLAEGVLERRETMRYIKESGCYHRHGLRTR